MNGNLDKLTNLDLGDTTTLTFTYSEGTDTFHYNETHVDTALEETRVVDCVAEVAASQLPVVTAHSNEGLLQVLREADLLEDYERGSEEFSGFIAAAIADNFYDLYELIEESTERYDHKRGFTTLTSTFKANVFDVLQHLDRYEDVFSGWKLSVVVGDGAELTWTV
jgi:hypothetical protein